MKFLIVNTDYSGFLQSLYAQHPGLANRSYAEQMQVRMESLFGVADFYSRNLRQQGHSAWEIHANNTALQHAWARENEVRLPADTRWQFRLRRGMVPWLTRLKTDRWFNAILTAQIQHYQPDVLLNQAMDSIPSSFFATQKSHVRCLVGQHAATALPATEDWRCYDLCLSSFPPTVDWFRSQGLRAELQRLAFEPRVLQSLQNRPKSIPISFVGSFHPIHNTRTEWLEGLCRDFAIKVWTPDLDRLPPASAIRQSYAGTVWGTAMYQVLHDSRITLNHHGNIPPFANNYRLYEATGVGALLMTDWKANLQEMFDLGKEVVAYRSNEECAELLRHYLSHPDEAAKIARAGQQRTLQEHTFANRMEEFVATVRKLI